MLASARRCYTACFEYDGISSKEAGRKIFTNNALHLNATVTAMLTVKKKVKRNDDDDENAEKRIQHYRKWWNGRNYFVVLADEAWESETVCVHQQHTDTASCCLGKNH